MTDNVDLLVWGDSLLPWNHGDRLAFAPTASMATVAEQLAAHVETTEAPWLLFWDHALGAPDPGTVLTLCDGRADAWHSGLLQGLSGVPEEIDYITPAWTFGLDADPGIESVSWRVSLAALLVKTSVLRTLGGLDSAFETRTGAGLELGRRMIDRGAVVMHTPLLAPQGISLEPLGLHDRFVLMRRVYGLKWVRYAALRRAAAHHQPLRVRRAIRTSAEAVRRVPSPLSSSAVATRDRAEVPADPDITVVLPTLGRYELLRPVLTQLRKQTIPARQVVVVDQNDPHLRDRSLYDEFADIGLEVVFQDERGQWISRNEAVRRARGEWIAFIDDDSEIAEDFLEQHLEGLRRYDADLSTGASLAIIGAPVPDNYAFFRVADQWDSGNGMCHRSLFERFGLFDQQFDRQRRGDAEFGLRVQLGGGVVIHNPDAIRIHLKAQEGGLRTFGSLDGFRHRDRTSPLPLPSMVYYTKRYHSPRQIREDLLIGLTQAIVPYELKRRATPLQWARLVGQELLHVPSTVRRIRGSLRIAQQMVEEGPRIPTLPAHTEPPGR